MFTIGDNLIVRVDVITRTTPSGIVMTLHEPDLTFGVVEVAGPGRYFSDGSLVKGLVSVGDTVWFNRRAAILMVDEPERKKYVISESSILAYETV